MRLNAIKKSILTFHIIGIGYNLYAIFIKKVADFSVHVSIIGILLTIMVLSILSWKQSGYKGYKISKY